MRIIENTRLKRIYCNTCYCGSEYFVHLNTRIWARMLNICMVSISRLLNETLAFTTLKLIASSTITFPIYSRHWYKSCWINTPNTEFLSVSPLFNIFDWLFNGNFYGTYWKCGSSRLYLISSISFFVTPVVSRPCVN